MSGFDQNASGFGGQGMTVPSQSTNGDAMRQSTAQPSFDPDMSTTSGLDMSGLETMPIDFSHGAIPNTHDVAPSHFNPLLDFADAGSSTMPFQINGSTNLPTQDDMNAMLMQAQQQQQQLHMQQQQQRHQLQQQQQQQRLQLQQQMQQQQRQSSMQHQLQQHLQTQKHQTGESTPATLTRYPSSAEMSVMHSPFSNNGNNSAYGSLIGQTSAYQSPLHQPADTNFAYMNDPMVMSTPVSSTNPQMNMFPTSNTFDNGGMLPGNARSSNITPANPKIQVTRSESQGHKSTSPFGQVSKPPSTTRHSSSSRSAQDEASRHDSRTSIDGQRPSETTHNRQLQIKAGFAAQPQNPARGSHDDKGMAGPHPYPDGFVFSKTVPSNSNTQQSPWPAPPGGWPSTMSGNSHIQTQYKNAYSASGFDMLSVLMRVATRPNPEINLGSVDMSCAFVVCNAEEHDFPIIYCSDNFERLTGYDKSQVLGRNCRFLQSPTGEVEPGVKRKYVDDDSVLYLKNMINARRESQISLINYRKGGQPFMNLLTMIPISWDTDQVRFFVGFQVDLVEQPNAVTNKNSDGSYSVNYQRGVAMPRYVAAAPEQTSRADLGQTIRRDDVTNILATVGNGESEYVKRMWYKVLLENTDDVIHVLSLKGLFQWVSPSSKKVLEYEPAELVGTALSSVCHPSDIVPVTRELKDTSSGSPVNVVFRIRRKKSGYMWFEGHGSLHTEQGKGRKSIIMVGRERPVYALSKDEVVADGGVNDSELWTKLSTSGMFLFVSSNVRQLLDRQPEDLVGVSIQTLMRTESKSDFNQTLERVRSGRKASVKHEVINRRGQVLQAMTSLYPGDASEGTKPTFLVAQTRLVKYPRQSTVNRPSPTSRSDRSPNEMIRMSPSSRSQGHQIASAANVNDAERPRSTGAFDAQSGLQLGHQDTSLASENNLFDELKTTKSSSWQYEIRQLEKRNRLLAEAVQSLLAAKKKRKRRNGAGQLQKDCANCHTRTTPEWRRGPSGQRDLCNSCGLRWAKVNGRVSPRTSSQQSIHSGGIPSDMASRASASPRESTSKLEVAASIRSPTHQMTGHAAQMEGAGGVPERIEEVVEPE